MGKSEQKRQKQLAKKRVKEKQKRREMARQKQLNASARFQMQSASRGEICKCLVNSTLIPREDGQIPSLGIMYFARRTADGRVAVMYLLVDPFCLGIKGAGGRIMPHSEVEEFIKMNPDPTGVVPLDPPSARKLAEGAIAYAAQFGIQPHPDYHKVEPLWGDVDPSESDMEFTYGVDGRPLYVPGPSATEVQKRQVMRRLTAAVGADNFDVGFDHQLARLGLTEQNLMRLQERVELEDAELVDDALDDEREDEDPEVNRHE